MSTDATVQLICKLCISAYHTSNPLTTQHLQPVFHTGYWYQQVKGEISIQLDNVTTLQDSNKEPVEVNGTSQTKWLNIKNTSYQPNQISLGARHPTIHEISIQLDNIAIIKHSSTEPMEVNGNSRTKWLNIKNTLPAKPN